MSKHSNHSQIGDVEMQFIYAINQIIKINWAYTIMFHMQHQQSLSGGLPYAILITKILAFYGVDFKREPKKRMNPKECEINVGVTLRNTRIIQDKDDIYKYKDGPTINAPPPVPKCGYSNEFLYNKFFSMDSYMMNGFRELRLEVASLKNLYHSQKQNQAKVVRRRVGKKRLTWRKVIRISLCVLCYYLLFYV